MLPIQHKMQVRHDASADTFVLRGGQKFVAILHPAHVFNQNGKLVRRPRQGDGDIIADGCWFLGFNELLIDEDLRAVAHINQAQALSGAVVRQVGNVKQLARILT